MNHYIKNLIVQGENQFLDYKFEISDAKKIARTFAAFANTGGGRLLIGIKDNGVITGIRTEEEIYMVESAADLFCKPRVPYKINTWLVEGKTILEIYIPESKSKPHLAPWKDDSLKAFIRINDNNYIANAIQLAVWKTQKKKQGVLVKYNNCEKSLLDYLTKNSHISFNQFRKRSRISYAIAKRILVNLISIDILEIIYEENTAYYKLKPTESETKN